MAPPHRCRHGDGHASQAFLAVWRRVRWLRAYSAVALPDAFAGRGAFRPPARTATLTDAAAFRAARRFVRTPFGNIAYVERGRGEAALFLHGFPLNSFQWRGALERLSPYRRCIAPDFLGLGYTEVAAGPERRARCDRSAMLAALLDALGIDDRRPDRQRQRRRGRAAVRRALSAARAHDAADQLRCRDRVPAARAAAGDRAGQAGQVRRASGWRRGWPTRRWRARREGLGGMCFTYPRQSHRRGDRVLPRAAGAQRPSAPTPTPSALERNSLAGHRAGAEASARYRRGSSGAPATRSSRRRAPDHLDRSFGNSRGVR